MTTPPPAPSALVLLLALLPALGACKAGPPDPSQGGAAPSPQAAAEPAPFTNPPTQSTAGTSAPDAGPPPEPLRTDLGVPPDVPRELLARDAGSREAPRDAREIAGYAMLAVLRTGEGPPPLRAPEVNTAVIDSARRRAEQRVTIEMSSTRARLVVSGGSFVLPQGTELRARVDRYGYFLLWPGEDTYRVAEPGSLRALLGERRLDVAPVSRAEVVDGGEGPRRLNLRTRRAEVSTRAAKATLELATLHDADDGGTLVCRMLLDLMSASPSTAACENDEVPLHAELRWTTQGALTFDVTSISRRGDLVGQDLGLLPPPLTFTPSPPPASAAETLVSAERARRVSYRAGRGPGAGHAGTPGHGRPHARQLDRPAARRLGRRGAGGVGRARCASRPLLALARPVRGAVAHLPGRRVGASRDGRRSGDERGGQGSGAVARRLNEPSGPGARSPGHARRSSSDR